MKSFDQSSLEIERLAALHALNILDTPAEKEFDDLVELAANICEAPVSLVTLVAENRQFFKARTGTLERETTRSVSFCTHALTHNDILLVKDATKDARFATNPMVTGEPHVRFYAGAPIVSPEGYKLGTLCIIDQKPGDLSWEKASALKTLAAQASKLIELRHYRIQNDALKLELGQANAAVAKLRYDRERKRRLSQVKLKGLEHFLGTQREVLKTGKFTKRELTEMAHGMKTQIDELSNFSLALEVLGSIRSVGIQPEVISLSLLLSEIQVSMADELKSASITLNALIPEGMTIVQDRNALSVVLRTVLSTMIRYLKKTEVFFVANFKDNKVMFRLSVMNNDIQTVLRQNLGTEIDAAVLGDTNAGVRLALVREIIHDLGGEMEVMALGTKGTSVIIETPETPVEPG